MNSHIEDSVIDMCEDEGVKIPRSLAKTIVEGVLMDAELSRGPVAVPAKPSREEIASLVRDLVDAERIVAVTPRTEDVCGRACTSGRWTDACDNAGRARDRLMGAVS